MAGRGRSGADELLAAQIAAGKTIKEAAAAAGVGERTVSRRLQDKAFLARVTELRDGMVRQAGGVLADAMVVAALVLKKLLLSADEHVRHKSAVKLIELGLKVADVAELQKRVEELERRADARGGKQP